MYPIPQKDHEIADLQAETVEAKETQLPQKERISYHVLLEFIGDTTFETLQCRAFVPQEILATKQYLLNFLLAKRRSVGINGRRIQRITYFGHDAQKLSLMCEEDFAMLLQLFVTNPPSYRSPLHIQITFAPFDAVRRIPNPPPARNSATDNQTLLLFDTRAFAPPRPEPLPEFVTWKLPDLQQPNAFNPPWN